MATRGASSSSLGSVRTTSIRSSSGRFRCAYSIMLCNCPCKPRAAVRPAASGVIVTGAVTGVIAASRYRTNYFLVECIACSTDHAMPNWFTPATLADLLQLAADAAQAWANASAWSSAWISRRRCSAGSDAWAARCSQSRHRSQPCPGSGLQTVVGQELQHLGQMARVPGRGAAAQPLARLHQFPAHVLDQQLPQPGQRRRRRPTSGARNRPGVRRATPLGQAVQETEELPLLLRRVLAGHRQQVRCLRRHCCVR